MVDATTGLSHQEALFKYTIKVFMGTGLNGLSWSPWGVICIKEIYPEDGSCWCNKVMSPGVRSNFFLEGAGVVDGVRWGNSESCLKWGGGGGEGEGSLRTLS